MFHETVADYLELSQDIRDARVFLLQKKAGSMGPNIFLGMQKAGNDRLPAR
jgi:hypothetical protein